MPVNKVIGLLNPKILEDRNGKGEISLSVDHPDKIMEMGDAIDCGKCGAKRADGSGCTNVVNTNTCEFCTFHVQKAYKNMSAKRPDLQSAFSGGGDARSRIMSKIDPKGKIFSLLQRRSRLLRIFFINGRGRHLAGDYVRGRLMGHCNPHQSS